MAIQEKSKHITSEKINVIAFQSYAARQEIKFLKHASWQSNEDKESHMTSRACHPLERQWEWKTGFCFVLTVGCIDQDQQII